MRKEGAMKVAIRCCLVCCIGALVAAPAFGQATVTPVIRDGNTHDPGGGITIGFFISADPSVDVRGYQITVPCELIAQGEPVGWVERVPNSSAISCVDNDCPGIDCPCAGGQTCEIQPYQDAGICDATGTCPVDVCVGGPAEGDPCTENLDCAECTSGTNSGQKRCEKDSECTAYYCTPECVSDGDCVGDSSCDQFGLPLPLCRFVDVDDFPPRSDWVFCEHQDPYGCTGPEMATLHRAVSAGDCPDQGQGDDGRLGYAATAPVYATVGAASSFYLGEVHYEISGDAEGGFAFDVVGPETESYVRSTGVCDRSGTCDAGACRTGTCSGTGGVCVAGPVIGNPCDVDEDCDRPSCCTAATAHAYEVCTDNVDCEASDLCIGGIHDTLPCDGEPATYCQEIVTIWESAKLEIFGGTACTDCRVCQDGDACTKNLCDTGAGICEPSCQNVFGDFNGDGFLQGPDVLACNGMIGNLCGNPVCDVLNPLCEGDGFIQGPDILKINQAIGNPNLFCPCPPANCP